MSMVAMKMCVQLEGGREENERKEEKDINLWKLIAKFKFIG